MDEINACSTLSKTQLASGSASLDTHVTAGQQRFLNNASTLRAPVSGLGSKMGIYATNKWPGLWPDEVDVKATPPGVIFHLASGIDAAIVDKSRVLAKPQVSARVDTVIAGRYLASRG